MPALEIKDAAALITAIVTVASVIFGLRAAVGQLKTSVGQLREGQAAIRDEFKAATNELLRQLTALHKRMDSYGERLTKTERHHAVLVERVANLRESQRFKLGARTEAAAAGEPPMLVEDGEDA